MTTRLNRTSSYEHLAYTSISGTNRRIKVEINLDEVPAVAALERRVLSADTEWWSGRADLLTFQPAELIATKFRALAQRSKGRDLNDLDVAHRRLNLDDGHLAHGAAHYLIHADIHPNQFRSRLASHLADPEFATDVAAYLLDPIAAGDPGTLVTRWIRWTDKYLDLAFAQLAFERAPSKRKQSAVAEIEERLASGTEQCLTHEFNGSDWRRCPHQLEATGTCPDHAGATA